MDEPQAGGEPERPPSTPSLLSQLCEEYPELSGRAVIDALEQANRANVLLGGSAETGRGRMASLARDRLDVLRIRSAAGARRSGIARVVHLEEASLGRGSGPPPPGDGAHVLPSVGVVDVPRFDRLLEVVRADAATGAAVSADGLCRAVARSLGAAAVALSVPDGLVAAQTIGVFGHLARWLEELQVTVGEGPSLDGLRTGLPVLVDDLDRAEEHGRWPVFAPAAADGGVLSLCVLPMHVGAARFGVLVLYLDRVGGLSAKGMAEARTFATIGLDLLLDHSDRPDEDLGDPSKGRRFYDDRPEIHQATGMVSVQLGIDLGTALLRLRAQAYAEDRLLSDLSADVVARTVRFDEGDDDDRPV